MSISYKRQRFPAELISYCVWLYYTSPLSSRDIQEMVAYRGIEVTYEAIRKWCRKFAQAYADQIRRQHPKPADKWHLDEVVIKPTYDEPSINMAKSLISSCSVVAMKLLPTSSSINCSNLNSDLQGDSLPINSRAMVQPRRKFSRE